MPTPRRLHPPIPRPHGLHPWPLLAACLLLPLAVACGSVGYQPITERPFQSLVDEGCGKQGTGVTTTAKINRVYEDSLVLWDGADPDTIVTMRLPEANLGQRTRGLVSKTRFEKAYEELQGLRDRDRPVTITATCRQGNVPAMVTRFSYRDADNQRREIELQE